MDFSKLKFSTILKMVGLALVAIIALVFAFRLIGSSFSALFLERGNISFLPKGQLSFDYSVSPESVQYGVGESVGLSARNAGLVPNYSQSTGDDAEDFEVAQYNALIETNQIDKECALVASLKARPDVIFETASEYGQRCDYVFKVKKDKVNEVLSIIKSLDPKELAENTYTIKGLVEDYTSALDILNKKLDSIDETLDKAIGAYDDIAALATKVRDVESLAKIIDSKINIIERLTQERININSEIERLQRSKAQQLDRLEYTYFNVSVVEDKFVDGQRLNDSWRAAVKKFINDINQIAQDITINLAAVLLLALQYALYLLLLLLVAKYGWQLVKYIWNK